MNKHLEIQEIPWDRIVHWYGRASDYPHYFASLKEVNEEEQKAILYKIQTTIEHQSTIIQVTPIALPFIYQLLLEKKTYNEGILEIIKAVIKAVSFQFLYFEKPYPTKKVNASDLIKEAVLWPPFIDEAKDEFLWETFTYEAEDWVLLTIDILLSNEANLANLILFSEKEKMLKKEILKKKKALREAIENASH